MLVDILGGHPWHSWPAAIVGTALISAAAYELFVMARGVSAPFLDVGVLGTAIAFNLPWIAAREQWPLAYDALLTAVVLLAFVRMERRFSKGKPNALPDMAVTLFGVFYVGILGGYIVQIHQLPAKDVAAWGPALVLYFVAVSKMSDIGGYLFGKFLGKHKLAPAISPGKTIEGSAGGLLLSLAAAFGLAWLLPWQFSLSWTIIFAVLVNVTSQFGDLAESMLKRGCNVKDSAVFLPKVCGALDLVDSILISAPVAYYLMKIAENSLPLREAAENSGI